MTLNCFAAVAQAKFRHLEKTKHRFDKWHTGEVTMIGALCCVSCGESLHFKRTGHIPLCTRCHATVYKRVKNLEPL